MEAIHNKCQGMSIVSLIKSCFPFPFLSFISLIYSIHNKNICAQGSPSWAAQAGSPIVPFKPYYKCRCLVPLKSTEFDVIMVQNLKNGNFLKFLAFLSILVDILNHRADVWNCNFFQSSVACQYAACKKIVHY